MSANDRRDAFNRGAFGGGDGFARDNPYRGMTDDELIELALRTNGMVMTNVSFDGAYATDVIDFVCVGGVWMAPWEAFA